MNLKHCGYYLEVVKCQSFSKASKQLDVNPTTLAMAMNALEDEVGTKLLYRTPYGIFPTEKGEVFYHDMSGIFHMRDTWKMHGLDGMPQLPIVRIGAVPAICNSFMPEIALDAAQMEHPSILDVKEMQIEDIDDAILVGKQGVYLRSVNRHEAERIHLLAENMGFTCELLSKSICKVFMHPLDPERFSETVAPEIFRSGETCCTYSRFKEQSMLRLYTDRPVLFYNQHVMLEYLAMHCGSRALLVDLLENSPWIEGGRIIARPWGGTELCYEIWMIWSESNRETADIVRNAWKKSRAPRATQ